ncbi:MAG: heavy metal-binding domain-containing protein [Chloroflexi bacterium]|nr:heavy metal-binding domain-containing protein [Chloroflexota bacterium]
MLVVTSPFVPGHRIVESLGLAVGLVVRSRGIGPNIAAAFRSLGGGEIHEYTQLLEETRRHAVERLVTHATSLGANAIVSMRFDSSEMGSTMSEIVAYGTAVIIAPDQAAGQGSAYAGSAVPGSAVPR